MAVRQCHGGVNLIALQQILVQTGPHSKNIHLFPAWPREKRLLKAALKNGDIAGLIVTPEGCQRDIVNCLN